MDVNVKSSGAGGKSFQLKGIENSLTVLELKKKCTEECGLAPEQQRLFLKGKLLKDADTLETAKVVDKATLFLVKGAATEGGSNGSTSTASTATAAAPTKEEKKDVVEEPVVSVPCVGGCGFFGTIKTENYCSTCYKKVKAKEENVEKKAEEEKKKGEKEEEEEKAKKDEAGSEATKQPDEEPPREEQKDKTKCWICGKKCGLLGFDCKCGYKFCSQHRYAEDHNCMFDHKARGREILAKNNPSLSASGGNGLDGV